MTPGIADLMLLGLYLLGQKRKPQEVTPAQPPAPPPPATWPTPATPPPQTPPPAQVKLSPLPQGYKPYQPPPPAVVNRAWALLPQLQMGQFVQEMDPTASGNQVAYRKEPHGGGKVGVTAYVRPMPGPPAD